LTIGCAISMFAAFDNEKLYVVLTKSRSVTDSKVSFRNIIST